MLKTTAEAATASPASTTPASTSPPTSAFTRRSAWLVLVGFLLVLLAASGLSRSAQIPPRGEAIPASAQSARVAAELAARPGSDVQPVLLVATRTDGAALTNADTAALTALTSRVTPHGIPPLGPPTPTLAQDGQAAFTMVPVKVGAQNTDNIATITNLRAAITHEAPANLNVLVTGGPAFAADIADAFSGADLALLLTTVAVVAVLLLLTYRSPTLWLIPLAVVALADQVAAGVTTLLGQASGLTFDAGIVSVLVFGAGTNYALLLISRYREELHHEADHRRALALARSATLPAILASNLTVVLALLTLLLALVPGTRGLGLAGAAGLLIAAASALIVLPAALSLAGRRIFWPFVPQVGQAPSARRSPWWRIGHAVTARPVGVVIGTLALLFVLAGGLFGTTVGLTQSQQFRVAADSQHGLEVLQEHFPAGTAAPLNVLVDQADATTLAEQVRALPGVVAVSPAGPPVDGRAALTVVGDAVPGSPASSAIVGAVRSTAESMPQAHALVGGSPAVAVDAASAATRDLLVIAPIILLLTGAVLVGLLRRVLVPLALLAVNVLSALATIGAGAWVGRELFGFPALDVQVPLIAFLFLVALGVDYTIFLVHRADLEAREHGMREGMARAVGHTGAVITSAGVVLAGVFAALGVLPLVVLGQLGLIVGLGVLIDTFVVRAMLVPGVVTLLSRRVPSPS